MDLTSFDSTIGPFVVGTFLALFLQGITLYNGVIFSVNASKQKEPWYYRVVVAVVMVIDLMHSAFTINTVYFWCVTHYNDPAIIALSPWSFTAEPVLTSIMAAIVHLFYAHRVFTLAQDDWSRVPLFGVIAILTLLQLSFGIAVGVKILQFDREFVRFTSWIWGACIWLGAAASADLIICVSYLWYLNRTSSAMAGPFERSSKAVIKVAFVILTTNGLGALCAILATVLFAVFQHANWHAMLQLTLAKFLALSLLIALNARTLLADLLGVDPGIFQSSAKRTMPAGGASSGSGVFRSKLGHASSLFRSGPYGSAAEAGGFDGPPPKSPGPSAVFSPTAMVRGADGQVFPVKASLGRAEKDLSDSDDDDIEKEAELTYARRESFPMQSVAFEDQIEQNSAHSSDSDIGTPDHSPPCDTHPYAQAR
ncbi:hypothetical protein JCM8202v2_005376 [Rhodotorula sphaerocarpa]